MALDSPALSCPRDHRDPVVARAEELGLAHHRVSCMQPIPVRSVHCGVKPGSELSAKVKSIVAPRGEGTIAPNPRR